MKRFHKLFYYFIIFLFTFTYFCFFKGEYYYVGDDTVFHTSNILSMAEQVTLGHLLPGQILPMLAGNFGYGVNLFYPVFPHLVGCYLYEVFSFFNGGITDVMKFIHFMVIFLSGIFMYHYIRIVFKNKRQALLTAILYQSMPYFFTDVFMRGALNESFLFMYLPLIFLSFHYLFEEKNRAKFYFYFVLGYSLFIMTHLVLTVYLTVLLIFFLMIYYKKLFKKENILNLVLASVLVLVLTSNFWVPLVEHHLLENYYILTLKYYGDLDVQLTSLGNYFFPLKFLNLRDDYYLLLFISPICFVFMLFNYFLACRKKITKSHRKVLLGLGIVLVFSMFFASSSFVWKFVPNLFKNIQFAWRLSLFVAFAAAVISGYGIRLFNLKFQKCLLVVVMILMAFSNYRLTSKLSYENILDTKYLRGDCCSLQWSWEYLPSVSKYNSLYLYNKMFDLKLELVDGKVEILSNDVPNMKFLVEGLKKEETVEFPRLYYLGYKLTNQDTGEVVELYQNSFGLLSADINSDGLYHLEYVGTIIDRITKVLSFGTFVVIIMCVFIKKIKN